MEGGGGSLSFLAPLPRLIRGGVGGRLGVWSQIDKKVIFREGGGEGEASLVGTSVSPLPRMEKKEEEERAAAVFIPPRVVTRADFSPPLLVVRSMRGVGRMIGISPPFAPKGFEANYFEQ